MRDFPMNEYKSTSHCHLLKHTVRQSSSFIIMKYLFVLCVTLVMSSPVPPDSQHNTVCSQHARLLLTSLSQLMDQEKQMKRQSLFAGFNCTEQTTRMIPFTQTAALCQPNTSANVSCLNQRNSTFSATECVKNIRDDLWYYNHMLKSYIHLVKQAEQDLSPVLVATENLTNCLQESHTHVSAEKTPPEWVVWSGLSFDDRLSLCKTLKGFYIRSITINRALGYISSEDHRK